MQTQENRNIPFLTAAAAIALFMALIASPAFARPGAGGGIGAGMGAGASMSTHAGSQSDMHMSMQGTANTNGPNSSDRDTGTLRADDRASANGLKHGRRLAKGHAATDTDGDSR